MRQCCYYILLLLLSLLLLLCITDLHVIIIIHNLVKFANGARRKQNSIPRKLKKLPLTLQHTPPPSENQILVLLVFGTYNVSSAQG